MSISLSNQLIIARRLPKALPLSLQLALCLVFLISLALRVWIKVETTHLGYQIAESRQLAAELTAAIAEYQMQISVLKSRSRILGAVADLGLKSANSKQIRKVVIAQRR
ncbi:MAG TPA: hypothetical protein PKD37_07250 [Oligoflexia bacterium]|nr:hypothetical protein [Oligoflexia bacterium]HMP27759.1 hypothetical protein [Oligoflexia bacterium]